MNSEYIEDITVTDMKKILADKAKDKELNYEQKLAFEYTKQFAKITSAQAAKLKTSLKEKFNMSDELATKLVDILPNKMELDIIFEKDQDMTEEQKMEVHEIIEKFKKE